MKACHMAAEATRDGARKRVKSMGRPCQVTSVTRPAKPRPKAIR
jgi:hypothetical protein